MGPTFLSQPNSLESGCLQVFLMLAKETLSNRRIEPFNNKMTVPEGFTRTIFFQGHSFREKISMSLEVQLSITSQ